MTSNSAADPAGGGGGGGGGDDDRRGSAPLAAALLVGAALAGFDGGSIGFVLPAMRAATGASAHTASWLLTVYVVGTLAGVPLAGLAARRWGAQRVYRICLALTALGGALASLAPGSAGLLAARALQGLGQAPIVPLGATLVVMLWPAARQGRLLGALSMAYGVAFLVAIVGTPWLLGLGWRTAFMLSASLAVAGFVCLPRPRSMTRVPKPIAHWRALLHRETLVIAVLAWGTGLGQAVLVYFPTLAIARLGVTTEATSLLMLPLVIAGLAATGAVTLWLDRFGARALVAVGAVTALAGIAVAALAPASRLGFMVGAAALGLGISALCGGPLRYAAARAVPKAEQGLAQSALALLGKLGILGGSLLLGALSDHPSDEHAALQHAMLVAAAIMALTFLSALALRPHRAPKKAARPGTA